MRSDFEIHQRENNEISENHLKENGKKFSRHCIFVLGLMYMGMRLTGRQLERDYNIDSRRLRDIKANRSDCKKAWRLSDDGKTQEMEYFLELPAPPTKKQTIENWGNKFEASKQLNLL